MTKRLLLLALLTSACASYTPQPATLLRIQSAAVSAEQEDLAVGVSPHLDAERNQSVFQADLKRAGVLPLQIVIRNNGQQTLEVRKNDFILRLADGRELSPTPPDLIASRLEGGAGVVGWTIAFGLAGYIAASTQQGEADNARRADLRKKELQDWILGPKESAQGFLFFLLPGDINGTLQATLSAKAVTRTAGNEIRLSLPLNELGAWNEPNRRRDQ